MRELISSTKRIKDLIAEYKFLTRNTVETDPSQSNRLFYSNRPGIKEHNLI